MPKRSVRPCSAASSRSRAMRGRDHRRRLAPRQVDVDVAGGDQLGGRRGAAEVQLRLGLGDLVDGGALDVEVAALEVVGPARQRAAQDRQELVGAVVALVVVEPVAEAVLLGVLAAGDDVQQQPTVGDALVRGRLLGGQRRRDRVGAERHEVLQALGLPQQGGGDQPRVLAPRARRREHAGEAELVGGAGDLGQVVDRRRTAVAVVAEREHRPAVARRRQEPVQDDGHRSHHGDCRQDSSTLTGNLRAGRRESRVDRSGFRRYSSATSGRRRLEAAAMTDNAQLRQPRRHGAARRVPDHPDRRTTPGRCTASRAASATTARRRSPPRPGATTSTRGGSARGPSGSRSSTSWPGCRTSSRCPTSTASATPGAGRSGRPTARTR